MSQIAMETIDVLESDRTNSEFATFALPDESFASYITDTVCFIPTKTTRSGLVKRKSL